MTRITQLALTDWKGETVESEQIDRLTAYVGPSATGKTARLKALMYAFMGHCGDGKRNEDIAEYAGPTGASVRVAMADGFSFARAVEPNENGGWTADIAIAGTKRMGVEKASGELRSRFGDFSPALDPDEIFRMKAEDSRDFILDLCQSANAYDADTICRLVVLELLYQHSNVGEATTKVYLDKSYGTTPAGCSLEQLRAMTRELLTPRENEALREIESLILGDLSGAEGANEKISAALDHVQDFTSLAQKDEKRGRLAAEGLADRRNQTPAVPGELDDLKARVAELHARETELVAQIEKQTEADKHLDTLRARITQIEADLAARRLEAEATLDVESKRVALVKSADSDVGELGELHQTLTRLRGMRDELVAEHESFRTMNEKRAGLEARIADLRRQIEEVQEIIGYETREPVDLEAEASRLEEAPPDLKAAREALRQLDQEDCSSRLVSIDVELGQTMQALAKKESEVAGLTARVEAMKAAPTIRMLECLCEACKQSVHAIVADEAAQLAEFSRRLVLAKDVLGLLNHRAGELRDTHAQYSEINKRVAEQRASKRDEIHRLERRQEADKARASDLRSVATWIRKLEDRRIDRVCLIEELASLPAPAPSDLTNKIAGLDSEIVSVDAAAKELRDQIESTKTELAKLDHDRAVHDKRRAEAIEMVGALGLELTRTQDRIAAVIAAAPNLTIESMRTELAVTRIDLETATDRVREKQAWIDLERNYAETLAAAEAKGTAYVIGGMAVSALKKVREHLMVELTRPVTALMTEFLERYEPNLAAFITLSKSGGKGGAVFRLGWIRNGRRISVRTISGGEKVVLTAALAYAVTRLKSPPLKLMLVDACAASTDILARLGPALEWAAEEFDNIVLAVHPTVDRSVLDGWLVHELEVAAEVVAA